MLKKWGVEKSNQFPQTDEGMTSARGCYKELSLTVSDLETPKAEIAAPMTDHPDWIKAQDSPDWGRDYIRVDGKMYRLVDGNYQPMEQQ